MTIKLRLDEEGGISILWKMWPKRNIDRCKNTNTGNMPLERGHKDHILFDSMYMKAQNRETEENQNR